MVGRTEMIFVQAGWLVLLQLNGQESITSHQVSVQIQRLFRLHPSHPRERRQRLPPKLVLATLGERVTLRPYVTFLHSNNQIL